MAWVIIDFLSWGGSARRSVALEPSMVQSDTRLIKRFSRKNYRAANYAVKRLSKMARASQPTPPAALDLFAKTLDHDSD
jgi:hypothetical protein